jgi:DUF917 family protein
MTAVRRSIGVGDLDDYAFGCAVFGTGGGGDVAPCVIAAHEALAQHGAVTLVTLDDLDGDDLVLPLSSIGAPTVSVEMLGSGRESRSIRDDVERRTGQRIGAVMAAEIGGANGVAPLGWAAELGLPLLDADGMGRAFPELQMISMNVAGVPPGVVTVADALGNSGSLSPADPDWAERWTRALCVASGSSAIMADYVMTPAQARGAVIEGSVTRAIEVGARVRAAADPIGELIDALDAVRVISGKVADIDKTTKDGFVIGTILIAGLGKDAGREVIITVQNECLAVHEASSAIATVPDLIGLFDSARGNAVPIEAVRFGHRVAVLAWPCDPSWRSDRGLSIAGPQAFGLDLPYKPLRALHG